MEVTSRKEALERGFKKYYTGAPCVNGHLSAKRVSNRRCIDCERLQSKLFRDANPESIKAIKKKHYDANREKILLRTSIWCINNKDKKYESIKRYKDKNKAKYTFLKKKYALSKIRRTPSWADLTKIEEMYRLREEMSLRDGVEYQVDHVIPLNGKLVSGLHVHYNLQIILAKDNKHKSNKFQIH